MARYGLHGRQIVEIGPGEGNFLALLCERGHNWGLGYDAAYDPERFKVATSPRMRIVRDHYPFDRPVDGELVVCQHVLEHLAEPSALVEGVRRSIPDSGRTAVYFEVPDATYMVSELAVWDLIYEHVSYFSAPTLELLFRRAGFDVTEVDRAFGDQYLYLEAVPAAGGPGGPAPVPDGRHGRGGQADRAGRLVRGAPPPAGGHVDGAPRRPGRSGAGGRLGRRLQGRELPEPRERGSGCQLRRGREPEQDGPVHPRHRSRSSWRPTSWRAVSSPPWW